LSAFPVQKLPAGDWLYEIKFDGYRAQVFKGGKDVLDWEEALGEGAEI